MALNWFKDYLSNRRQCVVIGNHRSMLADVTCGVPQGSVLGPTLFSLYVRNIAAAVSPPTVQIVQFADDIMLKESASDSRTVATNLFQSSYHPF